MKLDYQVKAGLSEEMTLEFLALRPRRPFWKRYSLPFLLAIFFILCFGNRTQSTVIVMGKESRQLETAQNILVDAAVGFGIGLLCQFFVRERTTTLYTMRVKTGPAAPYPARTFSWDESGIGYITPVTSHQYKWSAIDDIWVGRVGIHFIWRGSLLFSVPKLALPVEVEPEKLREMLRRNSPPALKSTDKPSA